MTKTVAIENTTHELIVKKQKEIRESKGLNIQIKDMIGKLVKDHINDFDV